MKASPLPSCTHADAASISCTIERCRKERWNAVSAVTEKRAVRASTELAPPKCMPTVQGLPFLAKNLFDVAGEQTLAGGPRDASVEAARKDAYAVGKLEDAGAVLVGTTHMDEYAYGFLGVNEHHGRTINPRNPVAICGGSSSGSAAAVAGGLVPLALGTDTNGSIRVPAALCGTFGFKPAYGCVSTAGVHQLAPSLDHVGWLASDLDTIEAAFAALANETAEPSETDSNFQLSLLRGEFTQCVDECIWRAVHESIPQALDLPSRDLPDVMRAFHAATVITAVEASNVHRQKMEEFPERYSTEVARKLRSGATIPQEAYLAALRDQEDLRKNYLAQIGTSDVLVTPVLPVRSPPVGDRFVTTNSLQLRVADALSVLVRPFSLTGLPVLVIPIGWSACPGLALQLIARPGCESKLWAAARLLLGDRGAIDCAIPI